MQVESSSVCMWEFGGRGLSTTHTTDTNTTHALTGSDKRGQRTHTSVWIRDTLQQHSQATLSLREKPFSLPPSLDLHQHTHTHTHTTAVYLSLVSCHETVSLRARNAVSSTVSQSVCIARCFCYGQASKFSTNIALGRMRETHPTRRNLARAS